jgi:hypothetical protein
VTSSPTPYRNVTTFPGSSVRDPALCRNRHRPFGRGMVGWNNARDDLIVKRPGCEPHTWIQYFCSPQHTDSAFYPVIAQLERAAAFERRSGQSDSEEVMSSPTPYRNVTMFPGGSLHTRQIRRNASEEVTSSPTPYRNVTTFPGSSVRNSSRTCIREPLTAVWAGTLNSWMMRKSFRFASIALNRRSLAIPADFGAIART